MIKRVLLVLAAVTSLVCSAQDNGQWKAHPKYMGSGTQNFIDVGNVAYLQCSNNLFVFNKDTKEVKILDKGEGVNDVVTTNIYHNYAPYAGYTVVTYRSSNIDVIHPDGSVTNIPDIADAVYNGPKGINDITFADGKMVVATEFGLVFIDDKTLQVTDTYYYNRSITSAMLLSGVLVVSSDDEVFYDTRKNHDDFSAFTRANMYPTNAHFYPINGEKFFMRTDEELDIITVEFTDDANVEVTLIAGGPADNIQPTPTGFIANFMSQGFYYTFAPDGSSPTMVKGTKEIFTCHPAGDGTKWAAGASGVHQAGNSTYYVPNGIGITQNAFYSTYNPGDGKVYVNRTCDNALIKQYNPSQPEIWSYDGNVWKNVTPKGAPTNNYANYWLVFEEGQPNSYFYSTRSAYIVHAVNDTVRQTHSASNSPLSFMNALRFDNDGNLWGVQSFRAIDYGSKYNPYVMILPKDKFNEAPAKENWITPEIDGNRNYNKRCSFAFTKGTNIAVYTIGEVNYSGIQVWDMEGDLNNPSPKKAYITSLPADDGANFTWMQIYGFTPDAEGNIWVATDHGLFYFDPSKAWSDDLIAHTIRIKMGTESESGRFLEGEYVYSIAIDEQGRKWVGTKTQGVFLLSADNKSVLAHYDISNSTLPSNFLYSITVKPNTNSVIFVTSEGVAEYFHEAPVLIENYDNVQAYPNPLRPDNTGFATITGLVKNSVLKITDRKGNTVATLHAQGTSTKWDGCNAAGERLETGVYNVYAGTSEETMSTTPVTQIRIIK